MPSVEIDKWFNVNEDARIWSSHAASAQKQGWLRAPAGIRAIDDYKGSYQFDEVRVDEELGGADERIDNPGYPQYWIRHEDVSLEPYEDSDDNGGDTPPPPEPVAGDAELGAALRTIVTFIAEAFRS